MLFRLLLFTSVLLVATLGGCQSEYHRPSIQWVDITQKSGIGTPAVRIYEGQDHTMPLRAWSAEVDLSSPSVSVVVAASDDDDGRETTSSISRSMSACVAVNAGYFAIQDDVARQVGLLVSDQNVLRSATTGIFREDRRLQLARSAIGFLPDGTAEIRWVLSKADSVFAWSEPPRSASAGPDFELDESGMTYWPVQNAVAAGPALLKDGQVHISVLEELFGQSTIPDVHPRTAAGITADGKLILLVIDGRQSESRGVNLEDLALILSELGAENALNLDGGGSSSFVVNGALLNRPVGGTTEREIVSAISVTCH